VPVTHTEVLAGFRNADEVDFDFRNRPQSHAFEAAAREVGFLGFGYYPRSGFIHIDLGPARQWGERFPVRATAFAEGAAHAREVLADSRTLMGGGAAGVATLGAAGVEVAQSVLAETQGAVLPLVPYLDTLRWVFIALVLRVIAVTIYARLDGVSGDADGTQVDSLKLLKLLKLSQMGGDHIRSYLTDNDRMVTIISEYLDGMATLKPGKRIHAVGSAK
jgi:hypothetical protein